MPDQVRAQAAIENLNGKELLGRQMNVNEAHPRTDQGRFDGQGGHYRGLGHGDGRRHWSVVSQSLNRAMRKDSEK